MSPLHTNINISERELRLVGKRHTPNALGLGCWWKVNPPIAYRYWTKVSFFVMDLEHEGGDVPYWSIIYMCSLRSILPPLFCMFLIHKLTLS